MRDSGSCVVGSWGSLLLFHLSFVKVWPGERPRGRRLAVVWCGVGGLLAVGSV